MKKVLILFFVITGIAIVYYAAAGNISWLPFGGKNKEVRVTDKVDQLELNLSSANVEIIPEKRQTVKAELDGKGKISVKQKGKAIRIDYSPPKIRVFSFFDTSEIKIYIPGHFDKSISLETGSGKVEFATGFETAMELENFDIELKSGQILLENLSAEKLSLEVGSGSITAKELRAEKGEFEINSGSVRFKEYTGEMDIQLNSGSLNVGLKELEAPISAVVNSGNLTLAVPEDSDFTLETNIASGRVINDFPLKIKKQENRKLSGTYGKGTHEIYIDINSGKANILKK